MPIFYECQRCTACCRWPGHVTLTELEIRSAAAYLQFSEHDFIQSFMRLREDRTGIELMERPDGACIFLEGINCRIQPVKPSQCRGFPNLWNFPNFEQICHAKPHFLSEEEYENRLTQIGLSRQNTETQNPLKILPIPNFGRAKP